MITVRMTRPDLADGVNDPGCRSALTERVTKWLAEKKISRTLRAA
jgi:DNA-binding TFAR19-related protein (PDSD5 family)